MKKVLFSLLAVVLGAFSAFGQTVTGQVLDSQREPIIGAGIVIPGKAGGAITDIDGHYSFAAKSGDVL